MLVTGDGAKGSFLWLKGPSCGFTVNTIQCGEGVNRLITGTGVTRETAVMNPAKDRTTVHGKCNLPRLGREWEMWPSRRQLRKAGSWWRHVGPCARRGPGIKNLDGGQQTRVQSEEPPQGDCRDILRIQATQSPVGHCSGHCCNVKDHPKIHWLNNSCLFWCLMVWESMWQSWAVHAWVFHVALAGS